ncbi:MAG: efflux RND transporter periplasmic adaptor subunit [Pseudomonadota bacterium]
MMLQLRYSSALLAASLMTNVMAAPETLELQPVTVATQVILSGQVEAVHEATLSAQVSARVQDIRVDVNDQVPPDTLVVVLDDAELKAQLQKAQSALRVARSDNARAEADYRRYQALQKKQYVTAEAAKQYQSQRDISRANVIAARAQIAEIEQKLTYTQIKAPYGGVVTARHIKVGETAQVGQPLLSGFDLSALRVQAHVPQGLISEIRNAGFIRAQNAAGEWHTLTDLTIFPQADPATHTVAVRGLLNPAQFQPMPGSYLLLAVPTGQQPVIRIPTDSLLERGDLHAVYVWQDGTPFLRQVVVGQRTPEGIVILSGLQAGEHILRHAAGYTP